MVASVLGITGVSKKFRQGGRDVSVLNGVDLTLPPGAGVALVGPSGCGKTTLLQIAGLLDRPTGGEIRLLGEDLSRSGDRERTRLRREVIGFVYQYHHLLPECSALENVMLPMRLMGKGVREAKDAAAALLTRLKLQDRMEHRPGQLSGGQQQRVAIARALANRPKLILADEPTGNLDPHTAEEVMALFLEVVRADGAALMFVTHNMELARRLDRRVTLKDGRLVGL